MPSYTYPGVYVEEIKSASGVLTSPPTAIAAFVGFTEKAPDDDLLRDPEGVRPRLVTSWTQYEKLYGGFVDGAMLPYSVYGYFAEGGSIAYIVRIPNTKPAKSPGTLEIESTNWNKGDKLELTTKADVYEAGLEIEQQPRDASGPPEYTVKITCSSVPDAVASAAVEEAEDVKEADEATDKVVKRGDVFREKFTDVTLGELKTELTKSQLIDVKTEVDTATLPLDLQTLTVGVHPVVAAKPTSIVVASNDFTGSAAERQGILGLKLAEEVTMVMVPDLVTAAEAAGEAAKVAEPDTKKQQDAYDTAFSGLWKSVQATLLAHCADEKNRLAILDAPPNMTPQAVKEWREETGTYSTPFGALYYPWIQVDDPIGKNGAPKTVPPSGHVAGIWARTDAERGVHKAPANEDVRLALNVAQQMTKEEQGLLNPMGINCIRSFGTRGIRVWGARTLAEESSEWRYINVRRLFNMIETAIMDGTQFAVFEPNDQRLWEGLKRTVNGYLTGLWRDGALFGNSASEAFFVKCDEENNTEDDQKAGRVIVEVGVAPVRPAEFVIFRISQKSNAGGDA